MNNLEELSVDIQNLEPYIWFYDHDYNKIIEKINDNDFIENCSQFKDENNNNLIHYLFFQLDKIKFTKNTFYLLKWLIHKCKVSINQCNSNKNSPFYYYMDYWFQKNFETDISKNELNFEIGYEFFVENGLDLNISNSFNENILHIFCHIPELNKKNYLLTLFKNIFNKHSHLLKQKNNNKQLPLHIALSSFRNNENKDLLNIIFKKTIEIYPLCISNTDNKGRNIYHLCLEYSHIHLCKYILNEKNYSKLITLPLQNENATPNVFIILINKHKELIEYIFNLYPKLFTLKDKKDKNVFDILYNYYLLTEDIFYYELFIKIHSMIGKIFNELTLNEKEKINETYLNLINFQQYKNYFCYICYSKFEDIRNWEKPFVCKNHPNQLFHKNCIKEYLKVIQPNKFCPMCKFY